MTLLPLVSLASDVDGSGVRLGATIFSIINLVLLGTAAISIRQFFWPGYENRWPFHIFNIIFTVLFYCTSLPFLVNNREYYVGYESLSTPGVIGRFFFTLDITAAMQWVICFAFVCNIIYAIRNYRDYFQAGLVRNAPDVPVPAGSTDIVDSDADAIP